MQQAGAGGRQSGHALLRALRQERWTQRSLASVLAQLHAVYRQLLAFEARHRADWSRDIPISRLVTPMAADTLEALEICLTALGEPGPLLAKPSTQSLCETWSTLAGRDPVTAFAVTTVGGYWLEPALRAALREALWQQPGLYNGDTRFCWQPGGPEGTARRQVWHGVMALGPASGRAARLAKAARLRWYDALLEAARPSVAQPIQLELPLVAQDHRH